MRISDWSSDVCSSDLLDKLLSPTAPADIITYVVDVDFYSGDDCFATEVFTIDASTPNGAQHRALDLSLDSIYNDTRVPDLSRRASAQRSEERRVGKECVMTSRTWLSVYN